MASVLFNVPARGIRRRDLRQFAVGVQNDVAHARPFVCLITSDADLQRWNREYRRQDYATDVLSFPSDKGLNSIDDSIGEIAISFHRATSQALDAGHSVEAELRILILHGVLHLLGMDHETDNGEMARAERRWRKRYRLPAGLIERVRG